MSDKSEKNPIVSLVSKENWKELSTHFGDSAEYSLIRGIDPVKNGIKALKKYSGGIYLVDLSFGKQFALQLIDDLIQQYPEMPIIAILESSQIDLIQSVSLAGARSFILKPFTNKNLFETVTRVLELQLRLSEATKPTNISLTDVPIGNQTISVFSPRGGVGCTTIASNLAISILDRTKDKVLIIDGKSYFGHLDVIFNLKSNNTIADLIPHAEELDNRLINDVVVKHASGVHILKGPNQFSSSKELKPKALYNLLVSLQKVFPFIIVDTGSSLTENTVTYLDFSKKIIVPINPDMNSLRDGREFSNIATSMLAYPKKKIMFIINNYDIRGGINLQYLESALAEKSISKIPSKIGKVNRSINRGVPILIKDKKGDFGQSIYDFTDKLIATLKSDGTDIEMTTQYQSSTNDILSQSSRLG